MDEAVESVEGNLPDELPSFVGRAREMSELDDALRASRLVTLAGVAGVGKTRLALQAGRQAVERFPDGVWLVPLSPVRDGGLVPHAIGLSMKVRDQTARPMITLLIEHLADRECLIVLDTCEHLVDDCGPLVVTLLQACPGVRMLATSRQSLRVGHEVVVEVGPLPTAAGGDAAALFVERAREHDPAFGLSETDEAAVRDLCDRLDGLPLALELAAAQVGERTVADLAERPDPRAGFDVPPGSAVLAPHGGLWTAMGWSHELCTPAEKLLWARASVFAGSFSAGAAQQVCEGGPLDDVPRTLARLLAKSVVVAEGDRYRFLDGMREYGAFWLRELGETRESLGRHRDRYLAMAREAFPEWTRSGQAAWYRALSEDFPEVRLAMETCLAEPGPAAVELSGALWFFWFSCEYEREGRGYLERALDNDPTPGPLRVRAAWALGCVMMAQGDPEGLERCIRECRSAAPDPDGTRAADYIESTDWAMGGRPDLALERLTSIVSSPWRDGVQEAVWLLARAALVFARLAMGDHGTATRMAEELRVDGLVRGEFKFQSWGHYIHSLVSLSSGDHATAADHADAAFRGSKEIEDSSNMALALESLALATSGQGDHERAAVLLGISHRLWHPDGGRARFTTPELAAARAACEDRIVAAIGQKSRDACFATGLRSAWP
ncbi:hypothetical protein [Spirillospora sp. NPDC047279]|uniref:ATP-binding protein n=1 Tax=Spirillospora sp. NPDC047279 TaxID=3155478 RepID=UPI0033F0EB38